MLFQFGGYAIALVLMFELLQNLELAIVWFPLSKTQTNKRCINLVLDALLLWWILAAIKRC